MVAAVRDAFRAMKAAYEEIGIMQRRICCRNIVVIPRERGMLVDWDCARDDNPGMHRAEERQGTWQFMSARQLAATDPPVTHTLQDDMESFLHVLNWVSLRFLPSEGSPRRLKHILDVVFETRYARAGKAVGGNFKEMFLVAQGIHYFDFGNPPLTSLLTDLAGLLAVRYQIAPSAQDIQEYNEERATLTPEMVAKWEKFNITGIYLQKRNRLRDATWMLDRLDEALVDLLEWPTDDKHR
ncbi:hypothetical protein Hypma_008214 [Hypsizygus marmoreus]|uniref:Fungal-type protein kinase domain-containing protein n=1 Tax=Hypsizygus marmoreus TaxID=39966 RepID=A0A369JYU2_HYPMA|nr:hypothetical protein Hypma_008214 [Hypsizygus marmoreus]